jgi:hyaluronan synthase
MSEVCEACLERRSDAHAHVCRPSRNSARLIQSLRKNGESSSRTTPRLALVPSGEDNRPKLTPFRPLDEATAALPSRWRGSLLARAGVRLMQLTCVVYMLFLLYWVWLAKDVTLAQILRDPVFYSYSILVSVYVMARFALAPFYRPVPIGVERPTCSIVIPAFNEERAVEATIDACYLGEYPEELLEVVVVDDGSTDSTWQHILKARERHPSLVAVRFSHNRGKRAGMSEGIRRSTGEIVVFIDSDSVIEPDGLKQIVAPFRDPRVGGVVGSAEVLNKTETWLTRMQQVRYYVAFHAIKGSESIFGAVTCASGCFSAYRRSALLEVLDRWEGQTFLGRKATYGDDRALTNFVLRTHRVVYQSTAHSHTLAPVALRGFLRQQLRWKKSWLRESLHVSRFIWRKHPVAAAITYMGVLFPWVAPIVVAHAIFWRTIGPGSPLFYLMGAYVMAVLYSLYYAVRRRSPLWWHGITFIAVYMAFLVWQTYYALITIRDTSWGTRDSEHHEDEGEVTVLGQATTEAAA